MKTIATIFIAVLLFTINGFSQTTTSASQLLVRKDVKESRVGGYKTFQLDNGESKHVKYNQKKQTLYILNLDFSVWKTVKLPLPKGHLLDEIKLISTGIFNDDDKVEVLYSCVVYDYSNHDMPEFSDKFITFTLNIINENGNVLLKEEDSNNYEFLESNGVKYFYVYKHIGNGFGAERETVIYSIPQKSNS